MSASGTRRSSKSEGGIWARRCHPSEPAGLSHREVGARARDTPERPGMRMSPHDEWPRATAAATVVVTRRRRVSSPASRLVDLARNSRLADASEDPRKGGVGPTEDMRRARTTVLKPATVPRVYPLRPRPPAHESRPLKPLCSPNNERLQ